MKKLLMDGDTVIIDGIELSKEKIKELLKTEYKYHNLSEFIRTTFSEEASEWTPKHFTH